MSIITELQEARELILKEENWTQGRFAKVHRDRHDGCDPVSQDAKCFCAAGALRHVLGYSWLGDQTRPTAGDHYYKVLEFLDKAAGKIAKGTSSIVDLNDDTDHETVIKAYDLAIDLAKGQA